LLLLGSASETPRFPVSFHRVGSPARICQSTRFSLTGLRGLERMVGESVHLPLTDLPGRNVSGSFESRFFYSRDSDRNAGMQDKARNQPADSWQREQWTLLTTSAMVLAGVALAFMLWFTRSVMVPFVLGVFVVAVVAPLSDLLESRARFPRWLSMIVVLLVVLIATLGFLLLLSYTAQEIYRSADRYVKNVDDLQQEVLDKSKRNLEGVRNKDSRGETSGETVLHGDGRTDTKEARLAGAANADGANQVAVLRREPVQEAVGPEDAHLPDKRPTNANPGPAREQGPGKRVVSLWHRLLDSQRMEAAWQQLMTELKGVLIRFLKGTIGSAVGLLSTFTFMLIFVLFLLAGRKPAGTAGGAYAAMESNIRRYLATKTALSAITGILVTFILAYFDLELAVVFGMLTFVLNFVPSIGSIIATLLPLPVAYAQFGSSWMLLWVLLLPGSVQMLIQSGSVNFTPSGPFTAN